MAFAPLRKAAEIPSIPPTSALITFLVIMLLMLGCSTPPPTAIGTIAARIQSNPSQPLLLSGGNSTARFCVVGFSWARKLPLELSSACSFACE